MVSLVIIVLLLGLCYYKTHISKPTKSVELNEEQFFDNIERAKKGDEAKVNKPALVMSNV